MKTKTTTWLLAAMLLAALAGWAGCGQTEAPADDTISGRIDQGLRVLTIDPAAQDQVFRIYRGDYVRPELVGGAPFSLEIPDLGVDMSFPVAEGAKPYFKVPDAGVYAFTAGDAAGTIEAVEYEAASFADVTAAEGAAFIEDHEPLVLDVRTAREFAGGHVEGAVLVPVQELQRRLGELAQYKDQPVFVYCRSGNRSTVASKLLIDAGHRQVVNLRRGIADWHRAGLPVVK